MMEGRPAILAEAVRSLGLRCTCPTCLGLDAMFPGGGYQLALFAYRSDPIKLVASKDRPPNLHRNHTSRGKL